MDNLRFVLLLVAALGCGLIAGVFFAFSAFVMRALARLPSAQGIAAMQSINVTVLNRWFFAAFFGTAVTCLALVILVLASWPLSGGTLVLAGSLLYLAGTILVTGVFNVPLNQALARADPDSTDAAELWSRYCHRWTAWNHVRTVAALLGATSLTLALG